MAFQNRHAASSQSSDSCGKGAKHTGSCMYMVAAAVTVCQLFTKTSVMYVDCLVF